MAKKIKIENCYWSDLSDDLLISSAGELKKAINEDSVRCSIRNILGTYKGERIFRNNFGSSLNDLVFENINESLLNRFSDVIKSAIEAWDNRVSITGIDFKSNDDNNEVILGVRFQIKSYSETFNTTVVINQ